MSIIFNGTEVEAVVFNGVDCDKVYMNGVLVFEAAGTAILTVKYTGPSYGSNIIERYGTSDAAGYPNVPTQDLQPAELLGYPVIHLYWAKNKGGWGDYWNFSIRFSPTNHPWEEYRIKDVWIGDVLIEGLSGWGGHDGMGTTGVSISEALYNSLPKSGNVTVKLTLERLE